MKLVIIILKWITKYSSSQSVTLIYDFCDKISIFGEFISINGCNTKYSNISPCQFFLPHCYLRCGSIYRILHNVGIRWCISFMDVILQSNEFQIKLVVRPLQLPNTAAISHSYRENLKQHNLMEVIKKYPFTTLHLFELPLKGTQWEHLPNKRASLKSKGTIVLI